MIWTPARKPFRRLYCPGRQPVSPRNEPRSIYRPLRRLLYPTANLRYEPTTGTPIFMPSEGKPALGCATIDCGSACDDGTAELEYTVQFGNTLTQEDCADSCAGFIGTPFTLTLDGGPGVCNPSSTTCCWAYTTALCGGGVLLLAALASPNIVTLTWHFGYIEAQWVWNRDVGDFECDSGAIDAELLWDAGDELLCSNWSSLSVTVT